jgi:polyisoprenoid-binding protein YceI
VRVDVGAGRILRRPWTWAVLAAVAAFAFLGFRVWSQVRTVLSPQFADVSYSVPAAPRLIAGPGETVYRIDPTASQAGYQATEKIAFSPSHRVTGTTNGIAGDIALNASNPATSRVGEIVINLEELHSDNSLRDARLRAAFLSSHAYPLARFDTTGISGLPASIIDGQAYTFTLNGNLTVKTIVAPVSWQVQATVRQGRLTGTATTTIKQSTFRIGPISIPGLVTTGDDVTLTLRLQASDPSRYSIPDVIAAPARAHGNGGPSFAKYVQPVLEQSCASCHNTGQVGAAHWLLQSAADASKFADGIRVVTQAKFMPPWPASGVGIPLAHPATLDPKTIDLIARWAAAGGRLDVPASTPIHPAANSAGPQPRRDLVLKMPQPYLGTTAVTNDYRCFVLDPHFSAPTFVTGYTVVPDQVAEIHHAQVFHVGAAAAAANVAAQGRDGRPGYSCYGGPFVGRLRGGVSSFTGEPGLIAGWAPGQQPVIFPDAAGILMQPGDVLVLQIHYHYDNAPTPDQTVLALQTSPGTAPVKPIEIVNPIGPVEIPCAPGATAPLCDRNAALQADLQTYGPTGGVEQALLGLCGQTVDGLAAGFDGIAHSSCDTRVPISGQLVSVFGHMHTLGQSIRLTLDPQSANPTVLLDIPTWNFDWQMNYGLATPMHVTAGQTVRMDCSWDRSLDPNRAERYILFAPGTEDEMCFSTYAIIPDG